MKYGSTYYNTFTMGVYSNYLRYIFQCAFLRIYQGTDEGFTYSIKKPTRLSGLGILKHGNYNLTIRWMYVMSTDTPTIIWALSKRHTLVVASLPFRLGCKGQQYAHPTPRHNFSVLQSVKPLRYREIKKKFDNAS